MPLVVDASVSAAWLLEDEKTAITESLLVRVQAEGALMPALWFYEIRNLMIIQQRRGRLSDVDIMDGLQLLAALPIELDLDGDDKILFRLAARYRLTLYDAAYLELAVRQEIPLATLDKALAKAARGEKVVVLPDRIH